MRYDELIRRFGDDRSLWSQVAREALRRHDLGVLEEALRSRAYGEGLPGDLYARLIALVLSGATADHYWLRNTAMWASSRREDVGAYVQLLLIHLAENDVDMTHPPGLIEAISMAPWKPGPALVWPVLGPIVAQHIRASVPDEAVVRFLSWTLMSYASHALIGISPYDHWSHTIEVGGGGEPTVFQPYEVQNEQIVERMDEIIDEGRATELTLENSGSVAAGQQDEVSPPPDVDSALIEVHDNKFKMFTFDYLRANPDAILRLIQDGEIDVDMSKYDTDDPEELDDQELRYVLDDLEVAPDPDLIGDELWERERDVSWRDEDMTWTYSASIWAEEKIHVDLDVSYQVYDPTENSARRWWWEASIAEPWTDEGFTKAATAIAQMEAATRTGAGLVEQE